MFWYAIRLNYTVPEVTLEALSKLVLQARNVTSKLQSISTTRGTGTKVWMQYTR